MVYVCILTCISIVLLKGKVFVSGEKSVEGLELKCAFVVEKKEGRKETSLIKHNNKKNYGNFLTIQNGHHMICRPHPI